jgi:hypothetical protein
MRWALRQFAAWCHNHGVRLFAVRREDIERFGRDLCYELAAPTYSAVSQLGTLS